MKKIPYYYSPSALNGNIISIFILGFMALGGVYVLTTSPGITGWIAAVKIDVAYAFDNSLGMGIFTSIMYGLIPIGIIIFIFFLNFAIRESIKNALFYRNHSIAIELDTNECIIHGPKGTQTIVFQNIKEIALYTLNYYNKGAEYTQRTVYFHLKEGFERIYQNTEQWNTDDSYCIGLPLVGLAISDLEIYSKIKELSGLTEVNFPE